MIFGSNHKDLREVSHYILLCDCNGSGHPTVLDALFLSVAPIVQENTPPSNAMFSPVVDRALMASVRTNYVGTFCLVTFQ